jgi:anti-sigma B factor antagonist
MKLKRSDEGSATVLEVVGRLDAATSDTLLATLQEIIAEAPSQVVLDLREMDYVSSAGLRVLLIAAKQVRNRPTRLTLCALRPNVAEVFEISGLTGLFAITAARESATTGDT